MYRFAPVVALATILAATAPAHLRAQAPTPFTVPPATGHFTDPANLAGERVRPRNGRELPIDGGIGANGQPDNALGLAQMLRKLNTRASLMLIVAHPDDEDGGMLTYYSRGLGARVAVLTLTRGEGGQNQMTGDFEDALGLLRTQELLSADRYMGVDQFFGTEVDFGFTKTKAEAFQKWNHERVLYDAVRAVRIYRPLVIAAVFSGAVTDGHGQHQVSGQIAQEVFKAAGDPNVFPELTKEGILPWQPLKVYARVPFSRVTDKGLYDYATGQTVPAEFTNYVTGQKFTTAPTPDVTINEGATDPLLSWAATNLSDLRTKPTNLNEPLSYVQFARIGLGLQRTQIGGGMRVPPAGRFEVGYHLYGSRVCDSSHSSALPKDCHPERSTSRGVERPRASNSNGFSQDASVSTTFFDGMDTSLAGLEMLAPALPDVDKQQLTKLQLELNAAENAFAEHHSPAEIAPRLGNALQIVTSLIQSIENSDLSPDQREDVVHELRVKQAQLNETLSMALGLQIDATASGVDQVAGGLVPVWFKLNETSNADLTLLHESIDNSAGVSFEPADLDDAKRNLTVDHGIQRSFKLDAKITLDVTRPYFTRHNIESPVYELINPALRNAPETPPAFTAWADLNYRGLTVRVGRVVHDGPQPVSIVPEASLSLSSHAQVLQDSQHSVQLATFLSPAEKPAIKPAISVPPGWSTHILNATETSAGETRFRITDPPPNSVPILAKASVKLSDHQTITEGYRSIGYGPLPRTNLFTPATDRIVPVDLKLPPENKRRIAYLPGTGDDVPAALASIGLTPTILKVSDLTADKLSHFDTVVLGVRTYNAHPDLHGAPTQALFDFARSGGNVVVQYQTPEFTAADAPYPLSDRNERVIDETAPVQILDASSPLLTSPNKITSADFNNWIEERGHGFLDSWDPHYTALTETHDPGAPSEHIEPQAPQRGGLITVQLGKGRWTYCAFALYRQLPEAVPGAFRLFVNLLTP